MEKFLQGLLGTRFSFYVISALVAIIAVGGLIYHMELKSAQADVKTAKAATATCQAALTVQNSAVDAFAGKCHANNADAGQAADEVLLDGEKSKADIPNQRSGAGGMNAWMATEFPHGK